ncbi:(E)-4-hydroxy-3-methylbut-2-enyl-diphosphate synthase [Paracrocinitomix mangrovi]|uniref:(E)-4-hydroxy-3-methylbut-2-enyl-diphosphate synthase n=1 Tax=Paracrocinitomix mangrovi TaxID=2862509 RepID=UPI001EDB097F|nr:(E)-4-hydroxy-3-methylbut-2-enyl-diphosphate synthase [Paracrocinitomix mangrovi]UKN00603.1 (E)-4-hydroxy-3-methylbut-2-enyl-diphosphate synthase [Paracrocinitomix mangrovi]
MRKYTPYCYSLTNYQRINTLEVMVGNVGVGGDNPLRLQSMTTTDTLDTKASVEQAIEMIKAGCEIVRFTAPSIKEAENLSAIKQELVDLGYNQPLVADIHFTPNAAEIAAKYVEKVRVNPGNYADKKKFEVHEYTDEAYDAILQQLKEKFSPLVILCKELGRSMRIGTNHGSLSDRIMSKYGDTPLGMVESALEFVDICEDHEYYDIIISMKSSNPQVMVQAYRLLMSRMLDRGRVYPLHLGVTEAGEGEDGRIKSAVGIGTLLEDGLGDTIRVSLTEAPEAEIPVARMLADRYSNRDINVPEIDFELPYNPFEYTKRKTRTVQNIGDHNFPVVVADLSHLNEIKPAHLFAYGYVYHVNEDKWTIKEQAVDYIYTGNIIPDFELPGTLSVICNSSKWTEKNQVYPLHSSDNYENNSNKSESINFIEVNALELDKIDRLTNVLNNDKTAVLFVHAKAKNSIFGMRRFFIELMHLGIDIPVIMNYHYRQIDEEQFRLFAATDFGAHLIDGKGDGLMISAQHVASPQMITSTAFGILQATRTRISKTEYISCPSCGRTLFDLQETTAKIRNKTKHLKGLKIGIMGCIVNGPGEMADADYGYVGSGKGKINLYKEKEVVKRNIPEADALEELIDLIKSDGEWIDP